ncbi:hypothetical protein ABZZ92_10240 [Streptomyces ardesiacus]
MRAWGGALLGAREVPQRPPVPPQRHDCPLLGRYAAPLSGRHG